MDISEKIQKLEKEVSEINFEIAKLKNIQKEYPDIKTHTNRWKTERLFSKKVNNIVNKVDISHNCGCCEDSPLEAWPYKLIKGLEIFSDPCCFQVGHKNAYGIGECPYDDWEEKFKKNNISEVVIKKVKKYFKEYPPEDCCDDYGGYY